MLTVDAAKKFCQWESVFSHDYQAYGGGSSDDAKALMQLAKLVDGEWCAAMPTAGYGGLSSGNRPFDAIVKDEKIAYVSVAGWRAQFGLPYLPEKEDLEVLEVQSCNESGYPDNGICDLVTGRFAGKLVQCVYYPGLEIPVIIEFDQSQFYGEYRKMKSEIINLTPHTVELYWEEGFGNLEQVNPTTWVADYVEPALIRETYPSQGIARVKVATIDADPINGIPIVKSQYGEIEGLPDYQENVYYIVSLPTISAALSTGRTTADLLSPHKVVRSRSNGSLVLGCMGFACQ